VAFDAPADLLHPLPLNDGDTAEVRVLPIGQRHFRLEPWPFEESEKVFSFPVRHVEGKIFGASVELQDAFDAAPAQTLPVRLSQ